MTIQSILDIRIEHFMYLMTLKITILNRVPGHIKLDSFFGNTFFE